MYENIRVPPGGERTCRLSSIWHQKECVDSKLVMMHNLIKNILCCSRVINIITNCKCMHGWTDSHRPAGGGFHFFHCAAHQDVHVFNTLLLLQG